MQTLQTKAIQVKGLKKSKVRKLNEKDDGTQEPRLLETGLRRMRDVLAKHVDSGKIPGLVA